MMEKMDGGTAAVALPLLDDTGARARAAWLEAACREIRGAGRGKVARMRAIARANPHRVAFGTLKRLYYSWLEHGEDGLADLRKARRPGRENPWLECYKAWCGRHNRSNRGAWRKMLEAFHSGAEMECGVGTWHGWWRAEHGAPPPAHCPASFIPRCARYAGLQRLYRRDPAYGFNLAAERLGRKAAHAHILPVLRTRAGLACGQYVEWDDVHLDVEVVMPGQGVIARPQAFVGYDVASGMMVGHTLRPQYPEEVKKPRNGEVEKSRRNSLKEREFRFLLAHFHTDVGFHPGGVVHVVEHGTTAVREGLELRYRSIPRYGEMIRFERSGFLSEAIHAGVFKGNGGGNPRLKAYCEQAHRNLHSALAMLPGQVGQDADHRPESHAALVRYEAALLRACETLPPDALDRIVHRLMDYGAFARNFALLCEALMDRADHRMEGFGEKRVTLFRLDAAQEWVPVSRLDDEPEERRAAIIQYLRNNPECILNRQMSRREAWDAGRRDLIRVPMHELPLMLDPSDAREVTVRDNGTFEFTDQFYHGPDKVIFHAQCKSRAGFMQALVPGCRYMLFTTPFHHQGVIVDKASGNVVGVCQQYRRAPRYDRDAIVRAAGAQNHDLAQKLLPIRGRRQAEAEQRLAMIGHNADVLREARQTHGLDTSHPLSKGGDENFWAEEDEGIPEAVREAH
ncbi:MAG: hypothetical protein FWH21_00225 [Kiritimatiellaeota bacterium]|nr:hypothetical protein [Kiritimatiellota bacterium]